MLLFYKWQTRLIFLGSLCTIKKKKIVILLDLIQLECKADNMTVQWEQLQRCCLTAEY